MLRSSLRKILHHRPPSSLTPKLYLSFPQKNVHHKDFFNKGFLPTVRQILNPFKLKLESNSLGFESVLIEFQQIQQREGLAELQLPNLLKNLLQEYTEQIVQNPRVLKTAVACLRDIKKIKELETLLLSKRERLRRMRRIQEVENKAGKVTSVTLDPGKKINDSDYYLPKHYFYDTGCNATKAMMEMELSDSEIKLKHPLEYTTKTQIGTYMEDYLKNRPARSVVIQNVPHDLDVETDLRPYLQFLGPLDGNFGENGVKVRYDMNGVPALVEVMYKHTSGVQRAVKEFNKRTVRGYSLFLKTKENAEEESAEARTVYLSGLGPWVKREDVLSFLSQYGHVLGMDFPMIDGEIEQKFQEITAKNESKEMLDVSELEEWKNEAEMKQKSVEEILQSLLKQHHMSQIDQKQSATEQKLIAQFFEIEQKLEGEKFKEMVKQLKELKSEDIINEERLEQVKKIQRKSQRSKNKANQTQSDNENEEKIKSGVQVADNLILEKILDQEGLKIEKIQDFQQQQLAETYAGLLTHLTQKRYSIEKRMRKVLQGHGIMDKVLIQSKNDELNPESISNDAQVYFQNEKAKENYRTDLFNRELKLEDFLTIEEQRVMIERFKQISPFQRWKEYQKYQLSGQRIGFMIQNLSPNFERNLVIQKLLRKPIMHRFRGYRGIKEFEGSRAGFSAQGMPQLARTNRKLNKNLYGRLQAAMKQYSPSFDALYSREKEAVLEYVMAAEHLRSMRLTEQGNQYIKEYRIKEQLAFERNLKKGLLEKKEYNKQDLMNIKKESVEEAMMQVYAAGDESKLDEKEIQQEQMRAVNMGYCFVTFASADEARLAVVAGMDDTQEKNQFSQKLEIGFKGYKGHADLDPIYRMAMIKRDSRLTSEMARLRRTKRDLQKVESEVERRDRYGNVLNQGKYYQALNETEVEPIGRRPSERGSPLQRPWNRLNQWRFWAKSHFDSAAYRDPIYNPYSREEEEAVRKKIKQFEKQQGSINLGELFGSPVTQHLEYKKHRLAFQAYKHLAFLKRGLNPEQYLTKTQPQEASEEFYKRHPEPEELLRLLFSKNNQTKLLWKSEEKEEEPGRKFNVQKSNQELLMEYLGDDLLKIPELDTPENKNTFGYFQDMKRMFPEMNRVQLRRQQESYRAELLQETEHFNDYSGKRDVEIANYVEEKEHLGVEITPSLLNEETIRDHNKSKVIPGLDSYPAPDVYRKLYQELQKQKKADRIPNSVELPLENKLRYLARMYRVVKNELEVEHAPRVGADKEGIKAKDPDRQAMDIEIKQEYRVFDRPQEKQPWLIKAEFEQAQQIMSQSKQSRVNENETIKQKKQEWMSSEFQDQLKWEFDGDIDNLFERESEKKEKKSEEVEDEQEQEDEEIDMRYEPYLQKRLFSKVQQYSDKEAMALFGKEFPIQNAPNNPENKKYSPKMKQLLYEIEQTLQGDLDLKRKKYLTTKQEQLKQVRIRAGGLLEKKDNYFKAKELNDPSPLEKYVDGEIKEQFIDKERLKQRLEFQGYLDNYRVDQMNDEEYQKYVERWADPGSQEKRTDIYQTEAYGSQKMLDLAQRFREAGLNRKQEDLKDPEREKEIEANQDLEDFGNENQLRDSQLYKKYRYKLQLMRQKKEDKRRITKNKIKQKTDSLEKGMQEKIEKLDSEVIPTIEQFYKRKQENRPILGGGEQTLEDHFHQSHFREDSGKHARGAWDQSWKGTNLEDELIDDFDMSEHEWLARVYSGEMTTQQFGLLQNEKQKVWARERDQIQNLEPPSILRHKYLNEEDVLRIYDTLRERMVYEIMHSGEIIMESEYESNHPSGEIVNEEMRRQEAEKLLNETIRENIAAYFCKEKSLKKLAGLKDFQKFLLDPRRNYKTREYYFDPNMGVTLEGHIKEILTHAPEISVQTREDEFGFAIVQLSLKKNYKYDLDKEIDHLSSRPDLQRDQAIQNWLEGLVNEASDVPLLEQMRSKLENYKIMNVDESVLSQTQKIELDQCVNQKLQGDLDSTDFLTRLQKLSGQLNAEQIAESEKLMKEKRKIRKDTMGEDKKRESERRAKQIIEQMMLRWQYERQARPLQEQDFIREKQSEEKQFKKEARALEWQIEDDSGLIELYEKQRETRPEGALDSYVYKNTLTEERYEKLKERVKRAKERRKEIQKEGLGEVKNYFRA